MVSFAGMKIPFMGLLLCVSYSNMVLDIIMVKKVHENSFTKTYPPAVVAHLVCSILQFCWCIFVIARSHRGFMARAVNMMIAVVFFMAFGVGSIAATTGLRHHIQYCPSSASNFDDCRGVLRGTEGLGFAMAGLNLCYAGYLAVLVSKYGSWSTDLYNIPARMAPNADLEKAPEH